MTVPMRARQGLGRHDRGAAAVEFALVVPLLLLVVFGIINFGFLFSQQLTLNNGVREGDRRAVVYGAAAPSTCDGIITGVQNNLSGIGMTGTDVQVKVTRQAVDGTLTLPCGGTYANTNFGSNGAIRPCVGSYNTADNTGGALIVEAKYVANIIVSYPPFPTTLTLSSKAVFRCEFT